MSNIDLFTFLEYKDEQLIVLLNQFSHASVQVEQAKSCLRPVSSETHDLENEVFAFDFAKPVSGNILHLIIIYQLL